MTKMRVSPFDLSSRLANFSKNSILDAYFTSRLFYCTKKIGKCIGAHACYLVNKNTQFFSYSH